MISVSLIKIVPPLSLHWCIRSFYRYLRLGFGVRSCALVDDEVRVDLEPIKLIHNGDPVPAVFIGKVKQLRQHL